MSSCLFSLASVGGIAVAYVSPATLLACIIIVPAGVAFAVVSYVLRRDQEDEEEEEANEEAGLPAWRNTNLENFVPCALEKELVEMIPLVKYNSSSSSSLSSDCVVCLAQFEEEELVKVLPPCQHSFHVPCIDRWFETHSTCPLCRRQVTIDIAAGHHQLRQAVKDHKSPPVPPLRRNSDTSANPSSPTCIVVVLVEDHPSDN